MGRETFKNIITSEELISQINIENKKLVEKFLKNYKTKRSPESVKSYKSNFNIFFCWNILHNNNKFYVDIKKIELQDFFDFGINELKWGSARFAQVHSSLNELGKYIENILDDYYPDFKNHIKRIEKPVKEVVRKKSVFSKKELDDLMEYLEGLEKYNECCLLALIMASGARVSELNRFNVDIIDINNTAYNDIFIETLEEVKVKGRGVNGKKIYRYILKDIFIPYYLKYLPIREQIMKDNNQDHYHLFVKNDGSPATNDTFRSWMRKWDRFLSKPWYPHAGRHFWNSYCLSLGLDPKLVQELQQWSSDTLVALYDDRTAKDKEWKNLDKFKDNLSKDLNLK